MEGIFLIHSINVIEKEIRKRRLLEDILSFPIACLKFDSKLDMELRTKCVLGEWPIRIESQQNFMQFSFFLLCINA